MDTLQLQIAAGSDLRQALIPLRAYGPDLVLCFGDPSFFRNGAMHAALRDAAPGAVLAGCSGAGEIHDASVHDGTLAITGDRKSVA